MTPQEITQAYRDLFKRHGQLFEVSGLFHLNEWGIKGHYDHSIPDEAAHAICFQVCLKACYERRISVQMVHWVNVPAQVDRGLVTLKDPHSITAVMDWVMGCSLKSEEKTYT